MCDATQMAGSVTTGPILQSALPEPPWLDPVQWRLPGVQPLDPASWLIRDDVFAEQMTRRDTLIATRESEVHAVLPEAAAAVDECFATVLGSLAADPGYAVGPHEITRPDGVTVPLDRDRPLRTLGRLVQSDFCLMQPGPQGHVLTAAILCFPAYWTLAEKLGRPMSAIHGPVPEYDGRVAKRVQRLFDAMRPDEPLWRANAVLHADSELFSPKRETEPEHRATQASARFVRSERQVLRKLPKTGAIAFSIHTRMVAIESLAAEAREALSRVEGRL